MSSVFTDVILYISRAHRELLGWHPQPAYSRLEAYAEGTYFAGRLEGVWGFVDGRWLVYRPERASLIAQNWAFNTGLGEHVVFSNENPIFLR
jgi:hypothetical protein